MAGLYSICLEMQRIQKELGADTVEIWCVKEALVVYIRKGEFTFKKQITEQFLRWKDIKDSIIFNLIVNEFKEIQNDSK